MLDKIQKLYAKKTQQTLWRGPHIPHATFRATFDSTLAYKKHSHPQLSLGYIEAGETLTQYCGQHWKLQQGDLILLEPEMVHSCNPVSPQGRSYCMLYLDQQWCLQQLSALYAQHIDNFCCEQVVFNDASIANKMHSLMQGVLDTQQKKGLIEQIAMQVLSTYCTINPTLSPPSPLVFEVRKLLLTQIEKPDCLMDIASQFSQCPETIIRAFTKQLGISPKAYLNNVRIEQSKLLLQQGETVVDTAIQLGFSDQSHFHKTFRNYCAMTPKQYQQVNFIQ